MLVDLAPDQQLGLIDGQVGNDRNVLRDRIVMQVESREIRGGDSS